MWPRGGPNWAEGLRPRPALSQMPCPEPDALPLFQQPQPRSVEPKQGPQAGGTTLTINGTHLDTGSEEDVRVTLNDVPCNVWVSPTGRQILVSPGPGDRVRALWP